MTTFVMINISPAAVAEIQRLKLNRQLPDAHLRLMIKPGGCLDFFYDLVLESQLSINNPQTAQGDRQLEINSICLVVDPQSWKYIESLTIDYAEDLMKEGFRFHNPQVKNTCGCGISFAEPA